MKKNFKNAMLLASATFLLTACGEVQAPQVDEGAAAESSVAEVNADTQASEVTENTAAEADSSEESTSTEASSIADVTLTDTSDQDFIEAKFEPKSYPVIEKAEPDYTGIYQLGDDEGSCRLVMQEDGSYYFNLDEFRWATVEGKAVPVSDGVLEIQSESSYTGTLEVTDKGVVAKLVNGDGQEKELSYDGGKSGYPVLTDYTGTYSYTKASGAKVVVTVGYDDNGEPFITLEDEERPEYEPDTFLHHPYEWGIFNIEDENEGGVIMGSKEREVIAPDAELLSEVQYYCGNEYIFIKRDGDKAYLYFRILTPVNMK